MCEWCANPVQDMIHLFWYCPESKKILIEVEGLINQTFGCNLEIKIEQIFCLILKLATLLIS